jgi:2-oxopropyl-CoM reductase (carboxylating)
MTSTRSSYGGSVDGYDATVPRSLGGRALVNDQWPVLRGSCRHQACVPHQLFSEAARESVQTKALEGRL